jgi:hypothetical protein
MPKLLHALVDFSTKVSGTPKVRFLERTLSFISFLFFPRKVYLSDVIHLAYGGKLLKLHYHHN